MLHACLSLFCAAGARVGYCWWGCCAFTVLAVVVLSCIPMLVGSALLWSKITPEFFEIARSYNDVVCIGCVSVFTIIVAVLLVVSTIMIFVIPVVCILGERPSHPGAAFACFCVVLLTAGIILIVSGPVWFASNMNIVENYEESSRYTFQKQILNMTTKLTWDKYQAKFKCCGYRGYKDYEGLFWNKSVSVSCCNTTTLPSPLDCLSAVKNVTEREINSSNIYTDGCPVTIVHLLNLNSSSVVKIGIASLVFSSFFFISPLVMILLTFALTAKDKDDAITIETGLLIGVACILGVCCVLGKANSD